jgi:hypothetical protein
MSFIERLQAEMSVSAQATADGEIDHALVFVPLTIVNADPLLPRQIDLSRFGPYRRGASAVDADGLVGIIVDRICAHAPESELAGKLVKAAERRARQRRAADATAPKKGRG